MPWGSSRRRAWRACPRPSTLALFAAATAVLLLVPGPSVLFIVARTLEHGRRGGLVSMLGVETGALVHVALATAGVSALVAAAPAALLAVKLAGAAYLLCWACARSAAGPTLSLAAGRRSPAGCSARGWSWTP